ncbi:unannotated protein [freshwater metagenome]|uniref:Unannotated protein n=1 Tax=freshwater metagenome TaxID=449393 RepID=A0A6J7EHX5_9ZZZZ
MAKMSIRPRSLRSVFTIAVLVVLAPAVTFTAVGALPEATAEVGPATGDCQAPVPANCIASFSPASAGGGDEVTITMDPSGVEPSLTASYLLLSNGANTKYVALAGVENRTGTFQMPVLPTIGTWLAIVYSEGDLQGSGTIEYTGPVYTCAVGFDAVLANAMTLCERRFTTDGSLTVPSDITDMQFLVVGGGGGGGGGLAGSISPLYGAGGGGGGGEVKRCTETVSLGDVWTVTVGSGGPAAGLRVDANVSGPGGDGTWSAIERTDPADSCSSEGGLGGLSADGESVDGAGGASGSGVAGGGGTITSGVSVAGGGGGGHGGVGGDGPSSGGAGGVGASLSATWFADLDSRVGGGGGGGSVVTAASARGGLGTDGGGNGTSCVDSGGAPSCAGDTSASTEANSPKLNTGGGGGGGAGDGAAGDGANGVVIVRYEYVESTPVTPVTTGAWIEGGTDQTCAAYASISAAVGAAEAADVIHICPGVYREPTIEVDVDALTFVGEGASEFDVRIDGEGNGNPENSAGHQIVAAPGMAVTLRNLTLSNGFIDCGEPAASTGGAAVRALTVTAHDVIFDKNVNCHDGTSAVEGGAVSAGSVTITDSTFTSNGYSTFGGAVYLSGSGTSTITGSTFSNNVTHDGRETLGGAVFSESSSATLTIDSSKFTFNGWPGIGPTSGGAVYSTGPLTVTNSTFVDNGAAVHGGAVASEGTTSVTSTTFRGNSTGSDGSALRVSGRLVVDSSTFESNVLIGSGAGTVSSTSTGNPSGDLSIINSTFYANVASDAPVLDAQGSVSVAYVTAVDNSTDGEAVLMRSSGRLTIDSSLFARNISGASSLACLGSALTVNASVSDENTCLPAGGTASTSLTFGLFTYHNGASTKTLALVAGNPAVDAGDCAVSTLSVDQSGVTRGADCDAGAFEFTGYTGNERLCPRAGGTTVVGTDAETGYPICQSVYSEGGLSSFVAPTGVTEVDVVVVGGGGGGGGGGTDAEGAVIAGGGGAGGSVAIQRGLFVTAGTAYPVSVGNAGGGGAGSSSGRGISGGSGELSSFGTGVTVTGGGGGTGGGFDGTAYVTGAGGATAGVRSGLDITGHGAAGGGEGALGAAWDTKRYFSAGGGGAGAGGAGSSGLDGALVGTISTQFSGAGGLGLVPVDPQSLFASPGWIEDLPSTFPSDDGRPSQVSAFGLAPGGGGGASLVLNDDTYSGSCGSSRTLNALSNDAGSGRGSAIELESGIYNGGAADVLAPNSTVCDAAAAASFGAGGGGGIGSADLANGLSGRNGVVIVRYLAGTLPVCGAGSGTASTTTTNGVVEMMITGDCIFVPPANIASVDAVVVGGGGAGATNATGLGAGGGGGGGEVVLCRSISTASSISVQIGAGGTWPAVLFPTEAGDTVFGGSSCTARGGQLGEVGNEFIPAGLLGVTPVADIPASGGRGGASGNAGSGGAGSLFSWISTPGVAPDEMYASAGGGGAGAGGAGVSPSCSAPGSSGQYTGDFTDITCGSSAGGAGVVIGSLTGASSSLFSGGTRRFGGGGGGASSYPSTGGTLGSDGGGNGATPASNRGTNATTFGGGGGGGFSTFIVSGVSGAPTVRATVVLDRPSVTGSGYQGAVIVRYSLAKPLFVCLDKTSVTYGERRYNPTVNFCVPKSPQNLSSGSGPSPDETGIPAGWVKLKPRQLPGVVAPTCTTDYVQGMGVLDTPRGITCTGGNAGDKRFDYSLLVNGLTITPAKLTVKAQDLLLSAGSAEPSPYPYTVRGFKVGDTVSVLTAGPVCDSAYTSSARVGAKFVITCAGATAANYVFEYLNSALIVKKPSKPPQPRIN